MITSQELPSISMVLLTYNSAPYVEETVLSAIQQTLPPVEIIVADDGSSDETWPILQHLQGMYPDILKPYRNPENLGISRNLNRAFSQVKGDWFVWGGGDDPFDPNLLRAQWEAVKNEPGDVFAFANVIAIDDQGDALFAYHREADGPVPDGDIFVETASRHLFKRSDSLFRNELTPTRVAAEIGLSDDNLESYQDWDFKNALTHRCRGIYTSATTSYYRLHADGFSAQNRALHVQAFAQVYDTLGPLMAGRPQAEQSLIKIRLEAVLAQSSGLLDEPMKSHYAPAAVLQRIEPLLIQVKAGSEGYVPELNFIKARLVALNAESGWWSRILSLRFLFNSFGFGHHRERLRLVWQMLKGPGPLAGNQ